MNCYKINIGMTKKNFIKKLCPDAILARKEKGVTLYKTKKEYITITNSYLITTNIEIANRFINNFQFINVDIS